MNEPTPVDSALEQQALEQQAQWLALEARLTDEELNDRHRDGLRRRLADVERQWAEVDAALKASPGPTL